MRGTFGNIRLRNQLVEDKEGPYTVHLPDGEEAFIYDAAMRYRDEGVPLIVIAETYERIHRSNLVGMGILPLQFESGQNLASLDLTGRESYSIQWGDGGPSARSRVVVTARRDADGSERRFDAIARLDGPIEVDYYRQGGILPAVLRRLAAS